MESGKPRKAANTTVKYIGLYDHEHALLCPYIYAHSYRKLCPAYHSIKAKAVPLNVM
jgi:hypothetical protein